MVRKIVMLAFAILLASGGEMGSTTARAAEAENGLVYYVDAALGSDANTGALEQPFRTIERARDALRELKTQGGGLSGPATVYIRGGTYTLAEPLLFTADDSGTASAPITYAAYPGEKPVISGGKKISGFTEAGNGMWMAEVPEAASGELYFEQLWVNGKWAVRAKTPNAGYHYVDENAGLRKDPATGETIDFSQTAFIPNDPQDAESLSGLSQQELNDVSVHVYSNWLTATRRVDWVNPADSIIGLSGDTYFMPAPIPPFTRYTMENFMGALDVGGEWFLKRTGQLYYMPRAGETMVTAEVVAPILDKLMIVQGDPAAGNYAEHLSFKGLAFAHTKHVTPEDGYKYGQAASSIGTPLPAVIQFKGARSVTFEGNEVFNIANYGLSVEKGSSDVDIVGNYMHDLGAGGVRVGETVNPAPPEPNKVHHITVDNNIIRAGGRLHPEGVGILIGQASDSTVSHNDISDLYYSGISAGWSWVSNETDTLRNVIEWNHIHHIGQMVMDDLGGIYAVGDGTGSIIRNNVIHDITRYDHTAAGLYNDNATTGYTLENNLVYDVQDYGYLNGYARNIMLRNNIFAYTGTYGINNLADSFNDPILGANIRSSFTIERNLIHFAEGKPFSAILTEPYTHTLSGNAYINETGNPNAFDQSSLNQLKQRYGDTTSVLLEESPFTDAAGRNFTLKNGETFPAVTGFVPFDVSTAGVYGDSEWIDLASDYSYQVPVRAPLPQKRPQLFTDDFESTPADGPMQRMTSYWTNGASFIKVISGEQAKSGSQSLKIQEFSDAVGYNFWPMITLAPYHYDGISTMEMDLMIDAGTGLELEFGDRSETGNQHHTMGLQIVGGELFGGDIYTPSKRTKLMDLPVGQWIHLKVSIGVGADYTQQYEVAVTLDGEQTPHVFTGLPSYADVFPIFSYFGMYSIADGVDTSTYIDNFSMSNESSEAPKLMLAAPASVKSGQSFAVTTQLQPGSQQATALDITFEYDLDTVAFVSAESLIPGVALVETKTGEAGKVRVIMASEGLTHAITEAADVLKLNFKAKKRTDGAGTTVQSTKAVVSNERGTEKNVQTASVAIQIQQGNGNGSGNGHGNGNGNGNGNGHGNGNGNGSGNGHGNGNGNGNGNGHGNGNGNGNSNGNGYGNGNGNGNGNGHGNGK
ncbi:right-handed parallel beta-helix repeat-containing protein [Paenibacillus contaminans]|uniref:Right handed beta helix domain-containing protein n=1 Tax=Paenibacillus contaminans TaxID=450362 RepID=A0A329MDN4_9BACL|nr:right-handed parallel beta-helix repeat-containing protein [Paenibacillus contaminans]RAV17768.1 hypothetical protein DQG23_26995 [Paenibacillus contaminans]